MWRGNCGREHCRSALCTPFRRALLLALTAVLLAFACASPSLASATMGATTPRFVEVAAAAGVSHAYTGGWTHFVGGGVATFDCDHDGDSDLFLAGGADPSALFRNESSDAIAFKEVKRADYADRRCDGCLCARHQRRRRDGPRRAARRREPAPARAGQLRLRNCQCRIRLRRGGRLDHRIQRDLGGR